MARKTATGNRLKRIQDNPAAGLTVAALPMYDWPEIRSETDAFWLAIKRCAAKRGVALPAKLERRLKTCVIWNHSNLALAQTCGLPLATKLNGRVRLIATPCYTAPGCIGPDYCSFIVARRDDPRHELPDFVGSKVAINSYDSQSGYAALQKEITSNVEHQAFFSETLKTGSHRNTICSIAAGEADIGSIDAVCWALAERFEPEAVGRLSVIGQTAHSPGLPLISAPIWTEPEIGEIRNALSDAVENELDHPTSAALMIGGMAVLSELAYGIDRQPPPAPPRNIT